MKKYSWILGAFFLLFGAVPVMAAEETPEAVEAGYILESPTEEGRDVFIQAGGEDSELSDVLLTIREEGREVQVEGEAISNVTAFHLSDAAELICMEGRLDGRAFRTELQALDGEEGIVLSEENYSDYVVSDAEQDAASISNAMEETDQTDKGIRLLEEGDEEAVVVIDPGHGPDSPGTYKTWDGIVYREEELTMEIAEYLQEELESYGNVRVYLTRDAESTPSIYERVEYASELEADILVSIHLNAAGDVNDQETTASGVEAMVAKIGTYNPENAQEGQDLARCILDELAGLGFEDRGFVIRMGDEPEDVYEDGSVSDYYGIVRYGQMLDVPSIIVEHGFLNNESDFRTYLSTTEARRSLAEADARGIAAYLGLSKVSPWEETLTGDWDGDGIDTLCGRIGNMYYFKNDQTGGEADTVIAYGRPDDEVLVGDWDGDGVDTLCVRRGKNYYFKNSIDGGEADTVIAYGHEEDPVLVGDWDGDGLDTLSVRRGKEYYFKNSIDGGEADAVIAYGHEEDPVLVGDWDGDGLDTLSVRRGKEYYFKNSIDGGEADAVIAYGHEEDLVLVGDWDGDGLDTLAVWREARYYFKNSIEGGEADLVILYGKTA